LTILTKVLSHLQTWHFECNTFLFNLVLPEINVNITAWYLINCLNCCLESISTELESLNMHGPTNFSYSSWYRLTTLWYMAQRLPSTTTACTWCQLNMFTKYNLTQNKCTFSEPAIEPQAIALKSGGCTAPPGAHLLNIASFLSRDDLAMLPPITLDNHIAIVCYWQLSLAADMCICLKRIRASFRHLIVNAI